MVETVGHASAGDELAWVRVEVDGERVRGVEGEGPGVAELAREVRGRTILEAAATRGLPLALDAFHDALAPVARAASDPGRVAVAMSGGVDSAVALLRVRESGREPVGITLRLWTDPAGPDGERACCSPRAVAAARDACHALEIPHLTLDLREEFRRAVVAPFVRAYARGETPNPCVRCNGGFRFAALLECARRIGAPTLATGHYARTRRHRGRLLLARSVDADKDQSYMLGRLDPALLAHVVFPLGEQTKAETRAQAREAGLAAAERRESQEACFLAGGDYRAFLERHGLSAREGPVRDEAGAEVGRHRGFWRVTAGQRKGLGVAAGAPVYALRTEPATNTIVVGPRESLARSSVEVRGGRLFVDVKRADVKLRHRSRASPATVLREGDGFRLHLDEPAYGVAPGQAAVLYEEDVVVGSGLVRTSR